MTSINGASNIDLSNIPLAKTYSDADIQGIEGVDYIVDGEITFEDDDISYTEPKRNNYPSSTSVNSSQNIVQNNSNNLADIPLAKTYSDEEISNATQGGGYFLIDENGNESFVAGVPVAEPKVEAQTTVVNNKEVSETPTINTSVTLPTEPEESSIFDTFKGKISTEATSDRRRTSKAGVSVKLTDDTTANVKVYDLDTNWENDNSLRKQRVSVGVSTKVVDEDNLKVNLTSDIGIENQRRKEKDDIRGFTTVGVNAKSGGLKASSYVRVYTETEDPVVGGKVSWTDGDGTKASFSTDTIGLTRGNLSETFKLDDGASLTTGLEYYDPNKKPDNSEKSVYVKGNFPITDDLSVQTKFSAIDRDKTEKDIDTRVGAQFVYKF